MRVGLKLASHKTKHPERDTSSYDVNVFSIIMNTHTVTLYICEHCKVYSVVLLETMVVCNMTRKIFVPSNLTHFLVMLFVFSCNYAFVLI